MFINRCGFMVLFFMSLYLTQIYNISVDRAGLVITAYGLGGLLGSYVGGRLTDSLGAYTVQKASLILSGVLYLVLGYLESYWLIMACMLLVGLVSEALRPANMTALSQVCPSHLRARGFALNRLAINFGMAIGPAIGGYLALINYKLLFWCDSLTCLLAAGIFFYFFKGSRPQLDEPAVKDRPSKPVSVIKDFYFMKLLLFSFLIGIIFVQFLSTYPLYYRNFYKFLENQIGLLVAINTMTIVVVEMVLMELLKKRSLKVVVAWGSLLLGGGFAMIPMGRGFLFAAITTLVWTLGEMLALPLISVMVANHSDDSVRGKYMGFYSLSFAIALSIGPLVGSKVYSSLGADIVWLGCGIIGLLLWLGFMTLKDNSKI